MTDSSTRFEPTLDQLGPPAISLETPANPQLELGAETASQILVTRVVRCAPDASVAQTFALLARQRFDALEIICLVNAADRLVGVVPLSRLTGAAADQKLNQLMIAAPAHVHAFTDQEKVASTALHHDLTAVPVVDAEHRLLGVVPAKALLQILRREHVEDLHRLAGIRRETARARHALEDPPARRLRHRLPWLLGGLAGSVVATYVMSHFEAALHQRVALAFFVPGLVYLADAIGTQTEAVAVRGLSLSHVPLRRLLAGELRTGLLIGAVLAAIAYLLVRAFFNDAQLAGVVAVALFAASAIAASVGLLLPWLLSKWGSDPAYGSGPLGTIIQDILSLMVYFLVASWLLR